MRKISSLIVFFYITTNINGQSLTQNSEGQSTIPLPVNGVGISLDIGKTEAAVGLSNYARVLSSKTKKFKDNFLIGANIAVKSSEGLGPLFSSGDIVPAGNLLAFAGYSISNKPALVSRLGSLDELDNLEKVELEQLFLTYRNKTGAVILLKSSKIADGAYRSKVVLELMTNLQKTKNPTEIKSVLKDADKNPENGIVDEKLKEFKSEILAETGKLEKVHIKDFSIIRDRFSDLHDIYFSYILNKKIIPLRATFFLSGGINARNFTRYIQLNRTELSKTFQDTLFRGGSFGIGGNFQIANYWIGVTYSYIDGDNFSFLKSKEYTLRTSDTSANQSLIGEKKITAYSGKYSKVESNQLNIDIIGDYKLPDTSRLLANLYLRSLIKSRDTSYIRNYTNIGAGLYFVNKSGKFLGGLYVELPDINNNAEKAKAENEINIRPPFRKLSFGIVTKFTFSSILNSN